MRTIRHLYLYLVAFIGLIALLAGSLNLSALLLRIWMTTGSFMQTVSGLVQPDGLRWTVLTLVALAVWAIHWWMANRTARTLSLAGTAERSLPIRKAYLWAGQFATMAIAALQAVRGLQSLLLLVFGRLPGNLAAWLGQLMAFFIGVVIALLAWYHLRRTAQYDADLGYELPIGAIWRRLYYYGGVLVSAALAAVGGGMALEAVLQLMGDAFFFGLSPEASWRSPLALGLSGLLVGLPLSLFLWRDADRLISPDRAGIELNAPGRKALIYSGMLAGTIVSLVTLGYVLWGGLLLPFVSPVANARAAWKDVFATPMAYFPVGLVLWMAFSRAQRDDLAWVEESRLAATMRRTYFYGLAAAGLGAFWYGLFDLLRLLLVQVYRLQPAEELLSLTLRSRFSLAAALAVTGGLAWWGHWGPQQSRARQHGPAGHAERQSRIRHSYLYTVVFVAVVIAVATLGLVVYRAPALLFGPVVPAEFTRFLLGSGVSVALALLWWISHGFVIRGDTQLLAEDAGAGLGAVDRLSTAPPWEYEFLAPPGEPVTEPLPEAPAEPSPQEPQASGIPGRFDRARLEAVRAATEAAAADPGAANALPVAVLDGADGELGAALLRALRAAVPEATLWAIGLNPTAQKTMLAVLGEDAPPLAPANAMARVAVVTGPSDITAPGGLRGEVPPELATAIAASPAHKVLLPPRDPQLRWVAAPDWPMERWIEHAVAEIQAVLENHQGQ